MSNDTKAAFLLLGFAVLAGFLLYLPFLLWFKWRRSRNRHEIGTEVHLTKLGWMVSSLVVAIMLGGVAVPKLAPSSTLASALQGIGESNFLGFVILVGVIVERVLNFLGLPMVYRKVVLPKAKDASNSQQ